MPLLNRMLASPLLIEVRRGGLGGLAQLLTECHLSSGGAVLLAVGPDQGRQICAELETSLPRSDAFVVERPSLQVAGGLQQQLLEHRYDAVVGIGGGQTIDVAKYAATRSGVPMVAVATSLAHDGICSPVASLDSEFGKGSFGVAMPFAVIVDLDYVHSAPPLLVRAGVGDVLSNLSAIEDWQLAHQYQGDPIDGLAVAFARTAAQSILFRRDGITEDRFLEALAEALILSGMAMEVAGTSQPCSGACHEIVHSIDALYPGTASHGELAGLCALFAVHLRGDVARFEQILACLRHHHLPVAPRSVGLDDDQFLAALMNAPSTRPGRYTILEHLDLGPDALGEQLREFDARVGRVPPETCDRSSVDPGASTGEEWEAPAPLAVDGLSSVVPLDH